VTDVAQHTQGQSEWIATSDGRQLYSMAREPTGASAEVPTVVFEAGGAASRSYWALVQPGVAEFARAVVYDRSGLGRSAPDPVGRTLDRMADDLNEVLDHQGAGPFILVGHSAGGPIVRLAAARRPDRVAGLVLVDPTDEAGDVLFAPSFRRRERVMSRVGIGLARFGLLRRLFRSQLELLPADARADMEREAFTASVMRTSAEQTRTFLDELAAWRDNPPQVPDVPVTVVSGGRTGGGMNDATRASANASHAHRSAAASHGRHVVAGNSGHVVPLTEPEILVAEVRRIAVPE